MVFLEIIELNFCGLNKNLRSTIIQKGEDEFKSTLNSFEKRELSFELDDDDYYYNYDVNNKKDGEINDKIKIELNSKNGN